MSGAGAFLAGTILSISGWPKNAIAGEVSRDVLVDVGISVLVISSLLWISAILVFSRVKMTKSSHEDNLGKLNYKND
jgi:hypothetical protein